MPITTPTGSLPHTTLPFLDPLAPVLATQVEKRMQLITEVRWGGGGRRQTKIDYLGLFAGGLGWNEKG